MAWFKVDDTLEAEALALACDIADEMDQCDQVLAGRCLADVTHRDDEHRQSVCVLPADHRTAHDDLLGCTWTDAEHHEPGNPARKPEDAPRTSERVDPALTDLRNGRPSDRNLAPLRGISGRPRITGKPGAWRPACTRHADLPDFRDWDNAREVAEAHHIICQEG